VDYRDRIVGRQVFTQVARLMKYRVVYEFAEFLLDAVQTTHVVPRDRRHLDQVLTYHARVTVRQRTLQHSPTLLAYTPDTIQYNTIQYRICKAPCCRGFRGAGEQDS